MNIEIDDAAIQTITKELKTYTPPSSVHHDIISVFTLHITCARSDNILDTELVEILWEDLPVETLYSFEVLKGTTFVLIIIRDFLRAEGVEYNRHPATNCISWGLVKMIYSDTEDIDFAYERLVQHKNSSRTSMRTNK